MNTIKRVGSATYLSLLLFMRIDAGMGAIHRIDPSPSRSLWTTAVRQGTVADQSTPIPIFNLDAINSIVIISAPGNYKVAEDLTCRIVITASNVALDLAARRVSYAVGSQNVITLASSLINVAISNGYIQNTDGSTTGGSGIYIGAGCARITVNDVTITGCTNGILCAGTSVSKVIESEFVDVNLVSNSIGMLLNYADSNVLRECNALYCTQAGFSLSNCQSNCVEDCVALKTQGTGTVAGFQSSAGTSNFFQRCVTKQTKTSSTTFGDKACGFLLTSSEVKTKIVDCIVNETDVISSPTAVTYGIQLVPTYINGASEMAGFPLAATVNSVRWSPDNKYVAVASNGNKLGIYSWNGTALTYITEAGSGVDSVFDAEWTSDGKYLCLVGGSGANNIATYSFNGSTLTLLGSPLNTGVAAEGVAFSPDGKYLAFDGLNVVQLYSFTPSSGTPLVQLQSLAVGTGIVGPSPSWSPDGQYFVVGNNNVFVFKVYPEGQMSLVYTYPLTALSATWSPCGKYIVAGDTTGTVKVLLFDGATVSALAQVTGMSTDNIFAVDWSPDGKYIVVGGGYGGASTNQLRILSFTGTALSVVRQVLPVANAAAFKYVHWSSDGKYIVACEIGTNIHMVNAMYGPQNCFIDNCRVCDTQASNFNMGRGIVAGGNNVCVRSACGNNNVNYSWGIPNVYDGKFEILRGVVQPYDNVSMPESL